MKPQVRPSSIDHFALQRDREMSPGARLDWLAAAWEFAKGVDKNNNKPTKSRKMKVR